jgi:hypothetical protein
MVVGKFDLRWTLRSPGEADPILVVHPDTVLSTPITLKGFEAVGRWCPEVAENRGRVQLIKLATGDRPQALWTGPPGHPGVSAVEDILGAPISEREDHKGGG